MPKPPPTKQRSRISPLRDGPYLVAVDDLTNSKGERLEAWHGVALCRCGASAKKPFCDGSHISIGFSSERRADHTRDEVVDYPGETGPRHEHSPSIRVTHNGPYEVQGLELDTEAWREGASRERFPLCRCGASRNKPFCDGAHRDVNFQDDRN